ncbi:Octanoyltransferase [Candidatus Gullanella endobia]|uniref:Octanoyltransferase n=1 Tax=Candidatus Gullanella endobia TaxID=1070130 RepID=A0A143WRK8_9ENTR|nr:lipoyl(octanoyl) transferase LipB [Candidatus Gullanella endobia]CUX96340.1 Octanoyltransferase [Candidatus Gullanella endobia]
MLDNLIIRQLGLQPYEQVISAMHHFTDARGAASFDEIWLVEHPQVFTQGQTGKIENLIQPGTIPVIQSDRGGQITFHGPGQQIMYVLLDLHRRQLSVRKLIILLEQIVLATLEHFSISAYTQSNSPGIYVNTDKICSLGLRIRKGCSLHGLALNVAMDLSPFLRINPCGYIGLRMTQVSNLSPGSSIDDVVPILIKHCLRLMKANTNEIQDWNPAYYRHGN